MMRMALPMLCLVVLHTPDGNEVAVDTHQILMVRTAEPIKHHLAHTTETVVFLSGYRLAVRSYRTMSNIWSRPVRTERSESCHIEWSWTQDSRRKLR